jgi:hypothetical protein
MNTIKRFYKKRGSENIFVLPVCKTVNLMCKPSFPITLQKYFKIITPAAMICLNPTQTTYIREKVGKEHYKKYVE